MDLGISGRWAIVCASSKGLGYGCAISLAQEGVNLVMNARSADVLAGAAKGIREKTGVQVREVACDITTAEGRIVVTNRADLYERLLLLRSHGITREPRLMDGASHGPWYYQQVELGWNYRLTDLQAALGESQMNKLDAFVARRAALARRYDELLKDLPLTLPWQHPDTASAWHLYVIRLHTDRLKKSRCQIVEELRAAGIGVQIHYIPVHTQPYYRRLGFKDGDCPEAEKYYTETISQIGRAHV